MAFVSGLRQDLFLPKKLEIQEMDADKGNWDKDRKNRPSYLGYHEDSCENAR